MGFVVGMVVGSMATLALVLFTLWLVGEGRRKARQPKPHHSQQQRHATTQLVLKATMDVGPFVRLQTTVPLSSLLAAGYNAASHGAGVLAELQRLCHTRTAAAQLWPNGALHLGVDELKAAALALLNKIGGVLRDECMVGLAPGGPASTSLLTPMMLPEANNKSTCMLYDPAKVQATQYFSINNNGYLVLDFGRYRRVIITKKRGRWGKVMEEEVEEPQLQVQGGRVLCWLFHGCPGEGQECGHLCGHPNCLNPRHHKWVSKGENKRMQQWHRGGHRGEVPQQHLGQEWG